MKKYLYLLLEKLDDILIIEINRPEKLNSINTQMVSNISEVIESVRKDTAINGIIITGEGKKSFIAGGDIEEFYNSTHDEMKQIIQKGQSLMHLIENYPKPIIAAINGYALGGGCELAMACHLRIASENALFGQPEVNLGMIPGYGGTQRLVKILGITKGMELLMTGEKIDAQEAFKLGLVNSVVPYEDLLITTINLLKKILLKSPIAITSIINSVNAYYGNEIGYETEMKEYEKCSKSEDFKGGTIAFIEKRKPKFRKG